MEYSDVDFIKNLYRPIQPAITKGSGEVVYEEWLPATELRSFIFCYWELKTISPLVWPFSYRVVADGCIDIFFNVLHAKESFVMGFCQKYTVFPLGTSFCYVGIRFYPTMFTQLFGIDAKELSHNYFPLDQTLPLFARYLSDTIDALLSQEKIIEIMNQYLVSHVRKQQINLDHRFYEALHLIFMHSGTMEVGKDLNTGLSPRQLRRWFNYYLGTSPKTFSKVVRFQNILRAKPSTESLKQNKLFYDVGYYDQSHFIKDFTSFYGVTPTQAFR